MILLNLGDLERYITDLQQDLNYSKANENYQKAQLLAPKNGKSYNQLAVVAVKSKKKLDAVYYYIRSLEASKPIESARERLLGIFHEIKKKVINMSICFILLKGINTLRTILVVFVVLGEWHWIH